MGRRRLVGRKTLARYGAPAAFLLAATIAVLLVRDALREGNGTTPGRPPAATAPAVERSYRIRGGDTLDSVALRFGTTAERLLRLNPGIDPANLRVGDGIRVR